MSLIESWAAPGSIDLGKTGVVHVLGASASLPHNQDFYDRQADNQRAALIASASRLTGLGSSAEEGNVTAGIGEIVSTGGGSQTATLMRFLQAEIVVRVGDTVVVATLCYTSLSL